MDISSAIVNIYKIEKIKISDYENLISEKGSTRYRVKLDTKRRGALIQDLRNPKDLIMIKCIKEYYSTTGTKQVFLDNVGCTDISKALLGEDFNTEGCIHCHSNCCSQLKSGKMLRLKQ